MSISDWPMQSNAHNIIKLTVTALDWNKSINGYVQNSNNTARTVGVIQYNRMVHNATIVS